jgi:hypothetical protein
MPIKITPINKYRCLLNFIAQGLPEDRYSSAFSYSQPEGKLSEPVPHVRDRFRQKNRKARISDGSGYRPYV